MVPIKTMADDRTAIVLSGDPKQLGPIVRSAVASHLGFATSFLNRLVDREVYSNSANVGVTYVFLPLPPLRSSLHSRYAALGWSNSLRIGEVIMRYFASPTRPSTTASWRPAHLVLSLTACLNLPFWQERTSQSCSMALPVRRFDFCSAFRASH